MKNQKELVLIVPDEYNKYFSAYHSLNHKHNNNINKKILKENMTNMPQITDYQSYINKKSNHRITLNLKHFPIIDKKKNFFLDSDSINNTINNKYNSLEGFKPIEDNKLRFKFKIKKEKNPLSIKYLSLTEDNNKFGKNFFSLMNNKNISNIINNKIFFMNNKYLFEKNLTETKKEYNYNYIKKIFNKDKNQFKKYIEEDNPLAKDILTKEIMKRVSKFKTPTKNYNYYTNSLYSREDKIKSLIITNYRYENDSSINSSSYLNNEKEKEEYILPNIIIDKNNNDKEKEKKRYLIIHNVFFEWIIDRIIFKYQTNRKFIGYFSLYSKDRYSSRNNIKKLLDEEIDYLKKNLFRTEVNDSNDLNLSYDFNADLINKINNKGVLVKKYSKSAFQTKKLDKLRKKNNFYIDSGNKENLKKNIMNKLVNKIIYKGRNDLIDVKYSNNSNEYKKLDSFVSKINSSKINNRNELTPFNSINKQKRNIKSSKILMDENIMNYNNSVDVNMNENNNNLIDDFIKKNNASKNKIIYDDYSKGVSRKYHISNNINTTEKAFIKNNFDLNLSRIKSRHSIDKTEDLINNNKNNQFKSQIKKKINIDDKIKNLKQRINSMNKKENEIRKKQKINLDKDKESETHSLINSNRKNENDRNNNNINKKEDKSKEINKVNNKNKDSLEEKNNNDINKKERNKLNNSKENDKKERNINKRNSNRKRTKKSSPKEKSKNKERKNNKSIKKSKRKKEEENNIYETKENEEEESEEEESSEDKNKEENNIENKNKEEKNVNEIKDNNMIKEEKDKKLTTQMNEKDETNNSNMNNNNDDSKKEKNISKSNSNELEKIKEIDSENNSNNKSNHKSNDKKDKLEEIDEYELEKSEENSINEIESIQKEKEKERKKEKKKKKKVKNKNKENSKVENKETKDMNDEKDMNKDLNKSNDKLKDSSLKKNASFLESFKRPKNKKNKAGKSKFSSKKNYPTLPKLKNDKKNYKRRGSVGLLPSAILDSLTQGDSYKKKKIHDSDNNSETNLVQNNKEKVEENIDDDKKNYKSLKDILNSKESDLNEQEKLIYYALKIQKLKEEKDNNEDAIYEVKELKEKYKLIISKYILDQKQKNLTKKNHKKLRKFLRSKIKVRYDELLPDEILEEISSPRKKKQNELIKKYSSYSDDEENSDNESESGENNNNANDSDEKLYKKKSRLKFSNDSQKKPLIYDNSYLFKHKKKDILIRDEIYKILNNEYNKYDEKENKNEEEESESSSSYESHIKDYKSRFSKKNYLSKSSLRTKKKKKNKKMVNRTSVLDKMSLDYTNGEIKDKSDINKEKNDDEDENQHLENRLKYFFANIQRLKNTKDENTIENLMKELGVYDSEKGRNKVLSNFYELIDSFRYTNKLSKSKFSFLPPIKFTTNNLSQKKLDE